MDLQTRKLNFIQEFQNRLTMRSLLSKLEDISELGKRS